MRMVRVGCRAHKDEESARQNSFCRLLLRRAYADSMAGRHMVASCGPAPALMHYLRNLYDPDVSDPTLPLTAS
jgi:hypothetical protein